MNISDEKFLILQVNIHKKRKNSLETCVVLLIFSLELEVSGVTLQKNT